MEHSCQVAILGAGVTGMCAAHLLSHHVDIGDILLVEASDYLGGQTRTDHLDGWSCDWGPNGFLDREPLTLQWVDELGLSDQLLRANEAAAHRFILRNGRLVEVFGSPRMLLQPVISIPGRLRMLKEPFVPAKRDPAEESIWDFAARRIGPEAADNLVQPMVSGIFGGDARQLSLQCCFRTMAAMESQYGSLLRALLAKKKEKKNVSAAGPAGVLTSFDQGIGYLAQQAARQLGRVLLHTTVTEISRDGAAFRVETDTGAVIVAEKLIVAMPAYHAAPLFAALDADIATALNSIPYTNIAVVCTGYRRERVGHDLNGFGFLVPRTEARRVLGCIWTSSIFPNRAPEGYVQLRTMYGGATDPGALNLSDNDLLDHLKREVHPLLDIYGAPDFVQIYRHPRGIPQYLLGHGVILDALDAAEQRHPGLVFAGNAYRGVGLNDCVLSAHRAVNLLTPPDH
jgi:protoporphyrinogen/coproporphyrinogen III oxidase